MKKKKQIEQALKLIKELTGQVGELEHRARVAEGNIDIALKRPTDLYEVLADINILPKIIFTLSTIGKDNVDTNYYRNRMKNEVLYTGYMQED